MKRISLLIFISFTISCVNTRIIRYENVIRSSKPVNYPIEILESSNVNRQYKVIGLVQANAGKLHSVEDTIEHLKRQARKMGGDALMDLQQGSATGGVIAPVGKMYYYGNVRENWAAKVIVWENTKTNNDDLDFLINVKKPVYLDILKIINDYLLIYNTESTPIRIGQVLNIVRYKNPNNLYDGINSIGTAKAVKIKENKVAMEYILLNEKDTLTIQDKIEYK